MGVTARVRAILVDDLPPAVALLACRSENPDPLVKAFESTALEVAAAAMRG